MLGKAAGMRGRDPLARLRKRLASERARVAQIEGEVDAVVGAAVTSALASLEEVPA
jgi:TPP-dependent pyruvate/acetoin dehydrogenase alpha subunit